MSNSTLEDYYKGMKMPSYDGTNAYVQMRQMNAAATHSAQVHLNESLTRDVAEEHNFKSSLRRVE